MLILGSQTLPFHGVFTKILQALLHHRRELGVRVAVGIRSPQSIIRERSDLSGVLCLKGSEALIEC